MAESTKLDMALARFDAAAEKLEAVLRCESRATAPGGSDAFVERESLLAEIAELQSENDALRQRNAELEQRTSEATVRVEHAMDRIRLALGDA